MTLDQLRAAKTPEDVFGKTAPTPNELRDDYRKLARMAHPDAGGSDELMSKLNLLYSRAQTVLLSGAWGKTTSIGSLIGKGEIANLYLMPDGNVLKMPRSPSRSNLMVAEAKALKKLHADEAYERWHPYTPKLIRSYRHKDPKTQVVRQVNVLPYYDGWYTFTDLLKVFPYGIGGRDMAWMWRRILVALGFVHKQGLVHGAPTPDHILIHPTMHGVVLLDWTLSGEPGDKRQFKIPQWEHMYRDEDELSFAGDVHMASMAMQLLAEKAPTPIQAFLKGCRVSRLPSAWKLKEEFDALLEDLYGQRRYRPLVIPATV